MFVVLGGVYGLFAWQRGHLDWLLIISGPLLVVGVLYLLSWRHHAEIHARS